MNRAYPLSSPRAHARQQGMALMIALVVLVVVSILGVVAMRTALFQSRVSVNSQTENLAFQAAESGIDAVLSQAMQQKAAGVLPQSPAHIFGQALLANPQRVCIQPGGLVVNPVVDDGILADADTWPDNTCAVQPGANSQVTTVVRPGGNGGKSALVENYDLKTGAAAQFVEIRSYAEVPNTNVRTIHVQEWAVLSPSEGDGG